MPRSPCSILPAGRPALACCNSSAAVVGFYLVSAHCLSPFLTGLCVFYAWATKRLWRSIVNWSWNHLRISETPTSRSLCVWMLLVTLVGEVDLYVWNNPCEFPGKQIKTHCIWTLHFGMDIQLIRVHTKHRSAACTATAQVGVPNATTRPCRCSPKHVHLSFSKLPAYSFCQHIVPSNTYAAGDAGSHHCVWSV
jgi:hypothetical protein